jgi:hypothetical protein
LYFIAVGRSASWVLILEDKILNIAVFSTFTEESSLKPLSELLNMKYFQGIAFGMPKDTYTVIGGNTFVPKGGEI